jgi:ATP-dependent helicase HrpA
VAIQEIAAWLPKLAGAAQSVSLQLQQTPAKYGDALADVRQQLRDLFAEGTLVSVPWRWLQHYPRFLQAIVGRLQKLPSTPLDNDRQTTQLIRKHWSEYERLKKIHEQNGWVDPELVTFRWMVEELRVSKFAQNLGTSLTVSEKRLDKQRESVRQS